MELLIAVLLIAGSVLLVANARNLPSVHERDLLDQLGKPKRHLDFEKAMVTPVARRIARLIHLSPYKKEKLSRTLDEAGFQMTAEEYRARSITFTGYLVVMALLMFALHLLLFKILGAALCVTAAFSYFKINSEADDRLREKRAAIESELPQFMRTIIQSLRYNRDLLGIIDKYRLVAGPQLRKELDILVTDMQTGNHEQALSDFEKRLHFDFLSTFISGLISQSKGVDQAEFLRSTEQDMKKLSVERLKTEAMKKPDRLHMAQAVLVISFIALWLTALGLQMLSGLGSLIHY